MKSQHGIRLSYFFTLFAIGASVPYLAPYFKEHLHLNNHQLGILLMMRPLAALIGQPFWSYIADGFLGRKTTALWIALTSAMIFPLVLFTNNYWLCLWILFIFMFFFGSLNSMHDTLALDFLEQKKTPLQFGNLRLFASLGFFTAVILTGFLYTVLDLKFLFLIFSISMICSALSIRRISLSSSPSTKPSHGTKKLLVFLRKKNVRSFLLAILISEIANQMAYMYLSLYAKHLGASNAQVGILWATATGFEMISMVFMPHLLKKHGLKTILLWGVFCVFFRWAPFALATTWWHLFPFQAVHIITLTFVYIGSALFINMESSPKIRFSAQAFYSVFVLNTANLIGSFLGGEISEYFGYQTLFVTSGFLGVIGGLIILFKVEDPIQRKNLFNNL